MNTGLLVIGDVVTDILAQHDTALAPATDTEARISMRHGGAAANAAVWAARTGAPDVRLLARVGADSAGWHEEALGAAGVTARLVVDDSLPTGVVIALVDGSASGERTFVTARGANAALGPGDWRDELLDGVGWLHLSGYLLFSEPGRALASLALTAARSRGARTSLDPASTGFLRQHGAAGLPGVDVLFPNEEEALYLGGLASPESSACAISLRTGGLVVMTRGASGVLVAGDGRVLCEIPATPAVAVDCTGAGDAFAGAYVATALAGGASAEAATAGCAAGARAVARVGAR